MNDCGTSTVTPPRASTRPSKPSKSTDMTSSMRVPKWPSRVSTISGMPPFWKAALILASPTPGMSTQVSRMTDMT